MAGATKQYEERWQAVQDRFKNDARFMNLVKREKDRRDHFLNYYPIDPNNSASIEKRSILMRDNSKWLNGMLVNQATPTDLAGVYWDGMGNSLRIKKIKGRHYFAIRKYESSHGHQGEVAGGLGEWKDGRASFTGKFDPIEKAGTIQFESLGCHHKWLDQSDRRVEGFLCVYLLESVESQRERSSSH